MSFYGSLISIPTLLSVMGVQTNYNVQKSYYASQLNALYYRQSRQLLRMHEAQLIRQQEPKYIQSGQGWQGMEYDADGNLKPQTQQPAAPTASVSTVVNAAEPGRDLQQTTDEHSEPKTPPTPAN